MAQPGGHQAPVPVVVVVPVEGDRAFVCDRVDRNAYDRAAQAAFVVFTDLVPSTANSLLLRPASCDKRAMHRGLLMRFIAGGEHSPVRLDVRQ